MLPPSDRTLWTVRLWVVVWTTFVVFEEAGTDGAAADVPTFITTLDWPIPDRTSSLEAFG